RNTQPIAVGVDPGSKGEGFTVKSKMHTYLNIQTHAVDWVKDHLLVHRNMRHARRFRNIPCRQNRKNRLVNKQKLPPSTKARWQWKLRICNWLTLIFPVSTFVVEVILLEFHRCQLHRLQHSTGHIRSRYGGTISAGFKRGSIIKHPKFGFCYVGGWQESPTKKDPSRKTISLHS
ncbi:MAG: RRXRR domain-containing protein, partial [Nostoc sp.]